MGQIGRWVATGTSQCTGRSPDVPHRAMAEVIVFTRAFERAPEIGLAAVIGFAPTLGPAPAIGLAPEIRLAAALAFCLSPPAHAFASARNWSRK